MTTYAPAWVSDASEIPDPFGYGQRAVDFLRLLKHPKSRQQGRAFELPRWMERIVRRVYGPCDDTGRRQVRNVVILLPRGNRKTTLGAALALLHLIGPERENGGQVVMSAADQKQARIAFEEAAGVMRQDKRIASRVTFLDYRNRIAHPKSGCVLEAISSDGATQHGRTPTFVLADELHAWKKRELWDVLRTGLVKVAGSLLVVISTAGRGQNNVAHDVVDYARKVARGEIEDPATLPVIFEASQDADWRDEAVWRAVNPGLADGFPDIEGLRQLAREAQNRPADREAFRQLHLNVWLDSQADPWLEMEIYDQGAEPIDLAEREGEKAWIGVDLGSTSDLTAVVLALRDQDGGYTVVPFVFAPQASLRKRQESGEAPYVQWAEEGYLEPTPGEVTDWDRVEQKIRELCERFSVEEIACDPWGARSLMSRLMEDGLPAVEHRQGYISMSAPMKAFERAVLARKLRHGGHPVLRWNVGNVVVDTDPAGNVKPNKGKARDKIDAAVAAVMAIGRAEAGESSSSIYSDSTSRPEGLLVF